MAIKGIAKPIFGDICIHPLEIKRKQITRVLGDFQKSTSSALKALKSEAHEPCKPALRSFNKVESEIQTTTGSPPCDVYQKGEKYITFQSLSVSAEQPKRIVHRYLELGHSIRKISREEKRARQTVTRIVRTAPETLAAERDLENFQEEMRSEFRGMAGQAFMKKDWRVAARWFDMAGISEKPRRR